jgi:hypothetical protein
MDKELPNRQIATEEQLLYAKILDIGVKIGLGLLVVGFILYASRFLPLKIPLEDLTRYWSLPVEKYLEAAGIQPGWSWFSMLGYGDFINFIAITFLAGVTILCYLTIIPSLFRKKDIVYACFAIIEVVVLVVAASGILGGGSH